MMKKRPCQKQFSLDAASDPVHLYGKTLKFETNGMITEKEIGKSHKVVCICTTKHVLEARTRIIATLVSVTKPLYGRDADGSIESTWPEI